MLMVRYRYWKAMSFQIFITTILVLVSVSMREWTLMKNAVWTIVLCPAYLGIQVYGIHLKNFAICNTSPGLFEHKSFLNHPAFFYHNQLARVESPEVESSTEIKTRTREMWTKRNNHGILIKIQHQHGGLSYALNVQLPYFSMNTSNTFLWYRDF